MNARGLAAPRATRFDPGERLRIVLRSGAIIGWFIACLPFYALCRLLRLPNPVPRWFLWGVGWLAGVEVAVSGRRAAGDTLFLVNHVSWLDIPVLAGATGTAFVGHDGLAEHPVLRRLCAMNRTVFVARHHRASVAEQAAQVRDSLAETGALALFPEGTTSDGTGLLPFKSALLAAVDPVPAGVRVQPVLLDFGADAPDVAWVGDEPGGDNVLKILARAKPVRIGLRFLPPLEGDATGGRKAMAAAAQAALGEALCDARELP